jgi:Na+/H+-translocating membrane pyrophosphatase
MIATGLFVLGSPFVVGILFGPRGVAGLLTGIIIYCVQVAISSSNDGVWDDATKYCETGQYYSRTLRDLNGDAILFEKGTEAH